VVTGDLTVDLRAERNPHGKGRIYTVTVQCADESGNVSTATVEVKVPRHWSHKWKHDGDSSSAASLTAVSALPTPMGAEIVFSLGGPADVSVTVLNLAGRSVRRIVAERAASTGMNSLVWNQMSDAGLKVPSGTYLVEVVANGADGSSSRAVTPLTLNR
jgi:hypothetical protein